MGMDGISVYGRDDLRKGRDFKKRLRRVSDGRAFPKLVKQRSTVWASISSENNLKRHIV